MLQPSTLCLGLEWCKHSPPVHLTDRHPVPSWALRLVGWGNLEHKAGGWPTETTTSLLCYNEFAFCLISDDLYHTSLTRPLPLAPDSLTLARLPGLGACRTLTATSYSTRHEVRCCCHGCEILVKSVEWDNADREGSSDPLPTELLVPNEGWFLIRTTQVWRNQDDNICEIYPRLIAGGFEADRCRCRVRHPTCIVLVCLKKQRKLVK